MNLINQIQWTGKTVAIFGGNYAPPHKGHVQNIYNAANSLSAHIVIITLYGSKYKDNSRYGMSSGEAKQLWESWVPYLNQQFQYIIIDNNAPPYDYLFIPNTIHRLFNVSIAETYDELNMLNAQSNEEYRQKLSRMYAPNVNRDKIFKAVFLRLEGYSSTSLVKCIKNIRQTRNQVYNYKTCLTYVPDELDENLKKQYLLYLLRTLN